MSFYTDPKYLQQYVYDDSGTRVLKYGHEDDMTVYVNSYYTVSDHEKASKHIFAGNVRLATLMTEYKDEHEHDRDHDEHHKHPPKPKETVFFYHGDHLGSNHYVTDKRGRVFEHLEYFPFGEQWIEEGEDGPKPKYRFTAKEWDSETHLYYYGARYYDPRTSVWASADPILGSYLDGTSNGGVYNSRNIGLYSYSYNQPVNFNDPDGRLTYNASDESFKIDKGDTLTSISKETGASISDLVGSNSNISDPNKIYAGNNINIPDSPNISSFKNAASYIGDTRFKQDSSYNSYFSEGVNKCNLYVALAVYAGNGSFPTREFDGGQVPALAADWFSANRSGMQSINQGSAVIGDVVSWKIPSINIFGWNPLGASGHTTIFAGGVNVIDRSGVMHTPDGGWGTMGAGSGVGGVYRSLDYLNNTQYTGSSARFTRYEK